MTFEQLRHFLSRVQRDPDLKRQVENAITADEVSIQISEPRKPALIRGVGQNDYTYLLMPLRV